MILTSIRLVHDVFTISVYRMGSTGSVLVKLKQNDGQFGDEVWECSYRRDISVSLILEEVGAMMYEPMPSDEGENLNEWVMMLKPLAEAINTLRH